MTQHRETAAKQLQQVLEEHGPALLRMAAAWTRGEAERDDLMQDIALSLLVALPTFKGACPLRAFVWRVAHNRCLLLSKRRRPARGRHVELTDEYMALEPSPEDQLAHNRRRRHLQDAMRTLKEEHRTVLILSFEGMNHDEIGAVLGVSANAVGVRLHRARAALTGVMQDDARRTS